MDKNTQRFGWRIRSTRNFPQPGVTFWDVSGLMRHASVWKEAIQALAKQVRKHAPDVTVLAGIDARGFLLTSLATELGARFVMIRKAGKLPPDSMTTSLTYSAEYGEPRTIELGDAPSFRRNEKVLIVDDVLATGGSMVAAIELVRRAGGIPAAVCVLCDVNVGGVQRLNEVAGITNIISLVKTKYLPTINWVRYKPAAHMAPEAPKSQTNDRNTVAFVHPSTHNPDLKLLLRSMGVDIGKVQWGKFPDGWPNITFQRRLAKKRVIFIGNLEKPEQFCEQICFLKVLPRQDILSLDIVFPFFGPGTMERVDREGVLATAEPLLKMISDLPSCDMGGCPTVHMMDVHAAVTRFYGTDHISLKLHSAIDTTLLPVIRDKPITIVFPDEGAAKRFQPYFEGTTQFPVIVCSKVRDGTQRVVRIVDYRNCPPGYDPLQHVLIVDDMTRTGDTIYECFQALSKAGAKRVDAFVTHAAFDDNRFVDFFVGGHSSGISTFYVTDTCTVSRKLTQAPFQVLPAMRELLLRVLNRYGHVKVLAPTEKLLLELTKQRDERRQTYVASTSPHKLAAVYRVVERTVIGVPVASSVPDQPLEKECANGAYNRLKAMRNILVTYFDGDFEEMDRHCYTFDIESGLFRNDDDKRFPTGAVDIAVACMGSAETKPEQVIYGRSTMTPLVPLKWMDRLNGRLLQYDPQVDQPIEAFTEFAKVLSGSKPELNITGDERDITYGQVAAALYGVSDTDWMSRLCYYSRENSINGALLHLLWNFTIHGNSHGPSFPEETTHTDEDSDE